MLEIKYIIPGEPVVFEYQERKYIGKLSKVPGAGKLNLWHLTVNNYYWGTLTYADKWLFHNQKNDMNELADFFGSHVTDKIV